MTKFPIIALLAAATALSLAACSPGSEEPAPDVPADDPATDIAASESIPAAMLGTWDYVAGTCDPASDLRLEIAPGQLVFYEAVGEVLSVSHAGDDVTFALAMEGEGETWEESLTYRLVEGGEVLESDMPAPTGDGFLRRKRCEG